MPKFTDEMRKEYVESGGVRCPFCHSYNITPTSHNSDEGGIYTNVLCYECNERWTDIYELSDVEYEER